MRKNKDFSAGPVWDDELNRYLVDITYPDQSRKRKRFKSLKKAQGFWARETTTIEEGTWNNNFVPKNVTAGQAFDQYREYCKAQNRSYRTHTETSLRAIEKEFGRDIPLARITTAIEKFKLGRVKEVSEATVDEYLSVFKAFFNWCDIQAYSTPIPFANVRQILRHKSIAMTLRYAHLSPRYLADKVKLLEKTTLPNSCQMQDATSPTSTLATRMAVG